MTLSEGNDIVLCINKLRQKFDRVLYLDLDLHHGDGEFHSHMINICRYCSFFRFCQHKTYIDICFLYSIVSRARGIRIHQQSHDRLVSQASARIFSRFHMLFMMSDV